MPNINRQTLGVRPRERMQKEIPSRNIFTKYYNDSIWRGERDAYLRTHPLCQICLAHDHVTAAEHVHHIRPFISGKDEEQRLQLLRNPQNFLSLCKTCHTAVHKSGRTILDSLTEKEYEKYHNLEFWD